MPLTMLVLSFFDPRSSRARDRNCSNTAKSKNYFSFLISLPLKLMSLLSFLAVIYKLFFLSINIKNHHRNLQKRVGDVHQKNPHWDFLNHNCSFPSQKVFCLVVAIESNFLSTSPEKVPKVFVSKSTFKNKANHS